MSAWANSRSSRLQQYSGKIASLLYRAITPLRMRSNHRPRIGALHHREGAAGRNIEDVSLEAGIGKARPAALLDRRLYGGWTGEYLWFADDLHTAHWIGAKFIDWKHRQDCRDGTLIVMPGRRTKPTRSGRPSNSLGPDDLPSTMARSSP